MKANELRIGNFIYYSIDNNNPIVGKFTGYRPNDNSWFIECDLKKEYDSFIPTAIPLTEEWLEKFGFEKLIKQGCIFQLGDFHVLNFSPLWIYEHRNHIKIYSVHQLQNLYFALTGEELTIK